MSQHFINGVWWHRPAILALGRGGRQRQEDEMFKVSLSNVGVWRPARATDPISTRKATESWPQSVFVLFLKEHHPFVNINAW